ncbi:VWA domain-containing protein [Aliidiomarina sp. Khilg15.8]
MSEFHFLRPWWLLALLVFILIGPWLWRHLQRSSGWHKAIASHLQPQVLGNRNSRQRRLPFVMLATAWLITTFALAGPAWERSDVPLEETERGVVVVMDMSMSTRAADVTPDRLTRLRFKATDLINQLDAAQIGVVAYAGDAFTITPLTSDRNNILAMLPSLSPEIMPVAGNQPLLAMEQAHDMLQSSGIKEGEIYWLSAGMRSDDYQELRRFFARHPHRLSALIAGNDERTPIRQEGGDMLRDAQGRLVMAQLNSDFFNRVTRQTGGRLSRLSANNEDIDHLLAQGPAAERMAQSDSVGTSAQWRDTGPYLALLLLPLVVWVSRRGVIWCLLPLAFLTPLAPVEAATSAWLTAQQRAQALYDNGEYAAAAELFTDPMRRGNALYRAGDYEAAVDAFAAEDSAESWFNRGNSYARNGDLAEASSAYAEALQRRPKWPEAQRNKEAVDELLNQQQEQSEQGNQSQQDDSEQQDESESEGRESEQDGDTSSSPQREADPSEAEQTDSEPTPAEPSAEDDAEPQEPQESQPAGEQDDTDPLSEEEQAAAARQLMRDDLTDEEREELEQLLRRIPNDPALLLRNRLRLEAERRRHGQPPRGAQRQW